MKTYLKFLLIAGVAVTLGACSSNEETIDVEKPEITDTQIDLMGGQGRSASSANSTTFNSSNVQIFSLDSPAANIRGSGAPRTNTGARPMVGNSNVQITDIGQPSFSLEAPAAPRRMTGATTHNAPQKSIMAGQPLSRVFFNHGSAVLDTSDIQKLAEAKRKYSGGMLSVEGYASERSRAFNTIDRQQANLDISMKRAVSVTNALIASGVPAEMIRTVAWGEENNANVNISGMSAEEAARRVDVLTIMKK